MTLHNKINKNLRVAVCGLGKTGISVIKFILEKKLPWKIEAYDIKEVVDVYQFDNQISVSFEGFDYSNVLKCDLIIVSPGINVNKGVFLEAKKNNIHIIGDIELFSYFTDKPVIAITGSNGKSTVTQLTGDALKAASLKVGIGGNIGIPALSLLGDDYDLYVLELSSYQLETIENLNTKISVFLNLSEDHIERYASFYEYKMAKQKIFTKSKLCIYNQDDINTWPSSIEPNQKCVSFDKNKKDGFHLSFCDGNFNSKDVSFYYKDKFLFSSNEIKLKGFHNYLNILVVLNIINAMSVSLNKCISTIKKFPGLPHRFQYIKTERCLCINDSKSTNAASTFEAIKALKENDAQLHLILGGIYKGDDFSQVVDECFKEKIKVYSFGKDGAYFSKLFDCAYYPDLNALIKNLVSIVSETDIILFSPGCASFDQFKNFEERGNNFIELIEHKLNFKGC